MAVTATIPTSGTNSCVRLRTLAGIGLSTGTNHAPPGFAQPDEWLTADAAANYDIALGVDSSKGASVAGVGGRGISCNHNYSYLTAVLEKATGGNSTERSPQLRNFTFIIGVRHPIGNRNLISQATGGPFDTGCPGVMFYGFSNQTGVGVENGFGLSITVNGRPTATLHGLPSGTGAWSQAVASQADEHQPHAACVGVGPEVLICQSNTTGMRVGRYANGTITWSSYTSPITSANATLRTPYTNTHLVGSGANGPSAQVYLDPRNSVSTYTSLAEFEDGTLSDATLYPYCQWALNHANGDATYPEPTKAIVCIGDSITAGLTSHSGVNYVSVLESALRKNLVAVYNKGFEFATASGIRGSITVASGGTYDSTVYNWSDPTTFQAMIPANGISTTQRPFGQVLYLINLGVNDLLNGDGTGTATSGNMQTLVNAIDQVAKNAKQYRGATSVGIILPCLQVFSGITAEAQNKVLYAALLAKTGANFDFVFNTPAEVPELCCNASETDIKSIQTKALGAAWQVPHIDTSGTNITLDGHGDAAGTGTNWPHYGPIGHTLLGQALARHSGVQTALGLTTTKRQYIPIKM